MSVAVEEKQDPTAKFGSQVDDQIAQATGRIRAHDLLLGGLTLAAFTAIYATAIILLDRYLVLPEWVRQAALLGFLFAAGGIAYWFVVRPLRNRINPLYAAARVESTIEDPKNSVTGYVEARERGEIHTAVKAAMSAKAAKAVGEADVDHAVDHRSLIVVGGVLLVFVLTLAVLFFVFRPDQFRSLISRAFVPFTSNSIAKRTQIDVLRPEPADPTITTGQTITVAVHIGGKVPNSASPDRVRVLLRHTQADPNYEVIAMDEGETTRDWKVKVPDYLVQNGFWYKVAAGDNETPEYRVTVRTLPMFTDYESSYIYPAYTRKPSDKATGPNLRAYKGTKVTLIGKTNREVAEGVMKFDAANLPPVTGRTIPGRPDCLEFQFTATENTRYKLLMTTTSGEKNADAPSFAITLDSDLPPIVQVIKPDEPEITLPANGQLKVDGTIGDDFGIDKVRLRMRVDDRELAPVPYMNGQSFLRAKDKTWPTDLTFKMSADLAKLTYADGGKFAPAFAPEKQVVVEYWVEAIDNCTEAKPVADWDKQIGNVGRSNVQRVRLTPPEIEPERKQDLEKQKDQRAGEEKQHNQQQQVQLDRENRKKPDQKDGKEQPKDTGGNPEAKKDPDAKGMSGTEGAGGGMPDPANPPKLPPENKKQPDEKQPGGSGAGNAKSKGAKSDNPPKPKDDSKGMNDTGMPGGMGMQDPSAKPPEAPKPKSPEQRKAEEDAAKNAAKVQNELNRNKGPGGDAKFNPSAGAEENRTNPAEAKPEPPPEGKNGMEPESKPADPMSKGGENNAPAQSKPQGNLEQKPDPDSSGKPGPQQSSPMNPDQKSTPPSEARSEPLGGTPGQDKPEPKEQPKADPKDPKNANKDPMSGSAGKPATEKPDPKQGAGGATEPKSEAAGNAAQAKPNAEPQRGEDRNATEPRPGSGDNQQASAGDAKPKQAPKSAEAKPMPKEGNPGSGMADPKPAPQEPKNPTDPTSASGASEAKPDKPQPPMGGGMADRSVEKGTDKPSEDSARASGGNKAENKGRGARKPNEKEMKELQQAAQDLQNPDPAKKQAAQNKLDDAIGKDKRQELEQLQRDLKSPDKATSEAARKKVDDLMNQAKKDGKPGDGGGDKKLSEEEKKSLQQAAQDLQSPDEAKRKAAQEKLDNAIGKDKRQELDQLQKDLKSPDKATRDAAQKKADDLMNQAKKDGKPGDGGAEKKLSEQEMKDLQQAAQDLQNPDSDKRKAAQEKIDNAIGKSKREELEQLQKDLKSPDKATREAAQKKVEDLMNQAKKEGGTPKGKELSPEEIAELAKAAQDLNSKDEDKRRAAEKALDEKLGEQARKELEDAAKKQDPMDPKTQKDLKKKIEEMARGGKGPVDNPPLPPIEDDPLSRAKTAQLQLEEFEKHRYDHDLHERLGWTDNEYIEFLKAARERAEQMAKEAQTFEKELRNQPKAPAGAPTLDTTGGFGKVENRGNGTKTEGTTSGPVVAPPGFENARPKFFAKPKGK